MYIDRNRNLQSVFVLNLIFIRVKVGISRKLSISRMNGGGDLV